jgi:hypothetical protein
MLFPEMDLSVPTGRAVLVAWALAVRAPNEAARRGVVLVALATTNTVSGRKIFISFESQNAIENALTSRVFQDDTGRRIGDLRPG